MQQTLNNNTIALSRVHPTTAILKGHSVQKGTVRALCILAYLSTCRHCAAINLSPITTWKLNTVVSCCPSLLFLYIPLISANTICISENQVMEIPTRKPTQSTLRRQSAVGLGGHGKAAPWVGHGRQYTRRNGPSLLQSAIKNSKSVFAEVTVCNGRRDVWPRDVSWVERITFLFIYLLLHLNKCINNLCGNRSVLFILYFFTLPLN